MKKSILFLVLSVIIFSCKSNEPSPNNNDSKRTSSNLIVGKWNPTYEQFDEGSQKWIQIQTLVALPSLEFTADGHFLKEGKPAGDQDCCGFIGNKYEVKDDKITFSEFKPCPNTNCITIYCDGWKILKLDDDVLEVKECPGWTMRYKRGK